MMHLRYCDGMGDPADSVIASLRPIVATLPALCILFWPLFPQQRYVIIPIPIPSVDNNCAAAR